MLLNLVYLYTSQNKTADLNAIVQGMSFLAAIPVAGQVLRLLLMACWAAAEAVVDAASLVEGGKVPLMKSGDTWNLTADQLLRLGEQGGGRASSYVRDGSKGLDYETYLLIFMLLTSPEKKLVRMTQLMECNIRLEEEYEDFSLARCITAAAFSGTVQIGERFFMHPSSMAHEFKVQYGY